MKQVKLSDLDIIVDVYASNKAHCKDPKCRKEIYWVTNPKTKSRMCISETEDHIWISHFKDCKNPNKF